ARVKGAGEYVDELIAAHRGKKVKINLAHLGVGAFGGPDDAIGRRMVRVNGEWVYRDLPEHIYQAYRIADALPTAYFDISWDVVYHALTQPEMLHGLVRFIFDHPDICYFGTDSVKAVNRAQLTQGVQAALPLFVAIAMRPGGREVLQKFRVENL